MHDWRIDVRQLNRFLQQDDKFQLLNKDKFQLLNIDKFQLSYIPSSFNPSQAIVCLVNSISARRTFSFVSPMNLNNIRHLHGRINNTCVLDVPSALSTSHLSSNVSCAGYSLTCHSSFLTSTTSHSLLHHGRSIRSMRR